MSTVLAFAHDHPEVVAISAYIAATAAHVGVGVLLHLFRRHDFAWEKLGQFIEADWATQRGLAILVTFIGSLATHLDGSLAAAVTPALAALVLACSASTLPIVRDTLSELTELLGLR